MKKILASFCLAVFFLIVFARSGDAAARDDGLARILFNQNYRGMFIEENNLCSSEKAILQEHDPKDLAEDPDAYANLFGYDSLFYDKANGYMEWTINPAPCGCGGTIRAAAYAENDGSYFFLRNDRTDCNNSASDGINASEPLERYMPADFGLQTFLADGVAPAKSAEAGFYLDADIPRQGTDTTLHLLQIPFGLYSPSKSLLLGSRDVGAEEEAFLDTATVRRDVSASVYKQYAEVERSARIIFTPAEFTDEAYPTRLPKQKLRALLLSGDYARIGEEDRKLLENLHYEEEQLRKLQEFGHREYTPDEEKRVPVEHLSERLRFFHAVYEVHKNLTCDSLVLGWNPDEGRFYIKEKRLIGKKYESFPEFLQNCRFWSPVC